MIGGGARLHALAIFRRREDEQVVVEDGVHHQATDGDRILRTRPERAGIIGRSRPLRRTARGAGRRNQRTLRRGGLRVLQAFGAMRLALADVGLRHAGDQRRGADVGVAQVIAQLLHQALGRHLRHRIDAHGQAHENGAGGCGGDDVAALARAGSHPGNERLRSVDRPPEVHAHAPVPVVVGAADHAGLQADAGVVHEDVHGAELLLDLVGLGFPAVALHHVVDHGGHARIIRGEHLQCIGKLLLVDVAQDHLRALFVQRARDAEANAAGSTGDVGHLVFHVGDGGLL